MQELIDCATFARTGLSKHRQLLVPLFQQIAHMVLGARDVVNTNFKLALYVTRDKRPAFQEVIGTYSSRRPPHETSQLKGCCLLLSRISSPGDKCQNAQHYQETGHAGYK